MEEHRPGRAVKDSGSYFQPLTLSSCLFLGNVVAELKVPPKKAQRALKNLKASHADLWHDEPCHSTLSQPLVGAVGFLPHPPSRKRGEEHIPPPTIPRDQMHSRPQSSRRSQWWAAVQGTKLFGRKSNFIRSFELRIPAARAQHWRELQDTGCPQVLCCLSPLPLISTQDLGLRARASQLASDSPLIRGAPEPWSCHPTFLMFSWDIAWKWNHGLISAVQKLCSSCLVLRETKESFRDGTAKRNTTSASGWRSWVTSPASCTDKKQKEQHFWCKSPSFLYFFLQYLPQIKSKPQSDFDLLSVINLPLLPCRSHVSAGWVRKDTSYNALSVQIISFP